MKKIFFLLSTVLLLNGCAESVALLGGSIGGASNGKIVQSSLNSAISYGVKKQTGKTPLEHALAYAEEKNPEKKKETCISFIKKTRSEFCSILNKQISSTNSALKEKTLEIVKKYPKNNKTSENTVLEEENFMSSFLLKTSPRKLAIAVQAKMKEKSKNKDLN
tara:strand:+ start:142 stop:630 length:489 start_codon:yes stop_codon:yes gene_type:complete